MDIARAAERLMGMNDEVWLKHANPWSVWTRVLTPLPLLALAIWSRLWIGWWSLLAVALVCLWIWLNPRAFSKPDTMESWAAQGVLGERVYLRHRQSVDRDHLQMAKILGILSGCGIIPFAYGLWAFDLGFTMLGIITIAGGKMWFVDRMVWIWRDYQRAGGGLEDLKAGN